VAIDMARTVGIASSGDAERWHHRGQAALGGKFKIAAVNACGRFTELDFEIVRKGRVTAVYKEKGTGTTIAAASSTTIVLSNRRHRVRPSPSAWPRADGRPCAAPPRRFGWPSKKAGTPSLAASGRARYAS
jgi:hypothetical protein